MHFWELSSRWLYLRAQVVFPSAISFVLVLTSAAKPAMESVRRALWSREVERSVLRLEIWATRFVI